MMVMVVVERVTMTIMIVSIRMTYDDRFPEYCIILGSILHMSRIQEGPSPARKIVNFSSSI